MSGLHTRRAVAEALGWSLAQVNSFSDQMLAEIVRPVNAALADELRAGIRSGAYIYGPEYMAPGVRVGRKHKGNPPLAIVGANPPAGDVIGYVAAIVYYHVDDDSETVRVHLFGDGGRFRGLDDGSVRIWPADRSDVAMQTSRDRQRVLLSHRRGLPLVGDF